LFAVSFEKKRKAETLEGKRLVYNLFNISKNSMVTFFT
jgi:hypothetical protein